LTAIFPGKPGLAGFALHSPSPNIRFNTIPPTMSFSDRRRKEYSEGRGVDVKYIP